MKNTGSNRKRNSTGKSSEPSDKKDKVPLLTPEGQNVTRAERDEDPPAAGHQKTTPKQPLYEDKTERYYLKKKQKNKA